VASALQEVHVWPLELEIAVTSTRLDFAGDPADELIAATSVVHRVPLLTRDRRIRRSKIVPIAG
jgi:PIN domain nuclease of toxin-antitoxin system